MCPTKLEERKIEKKNNNRDIWIEFLTLSFLPSIHKYSEKCPFSVADIKFSERSPQFMWHLNTKEMTSLISWAQSGKCRNWRFWKDCILFGEKWISNWLHLWFQIIHRIFKIDRNYCWQCQHWEQWRNIFMNLYCFAKHEDQTYLFFINNMEYEFK